MTTKSAYAVHYDNTAVVTRDGLPFPYQEVRRYSHTHPDPHAAEKVADIRAQRYVDKMGPGWTCVPEDAIHVILGAAPQGGSV